MSNGASRAAPSDRQTRGGDSEEVAQRFWPVPTSLPSPFVPGQHSVPLAYPWLGGDEIREVSKVVASRRLVCGSVVKLFEDEFAAAIGTRHAIAVSSGSAALLVAMQALGVRPNDEVIVPDITFVTTASAALYLGAIPVFADIEPKYHGIAPAQLEQRITPRTRLIVPVHYGGGACDIGRILEIARHRDIAVLEDAAGAHFSTFEGRRLGTFGAAGIFSFTPSKVMTTCEGGVIVTDDDETATRCHLSRNFGDSAKFQWDSLGFNFLMSDINAAIGRCQLDRIGQILSRRRTIAERYTVAFRRSSRIVTPSVRGTATTNHQLYTIRLRPAKQAITRDSLMSELEKLGIASRLYYPPLHRQAVFRRVRQYNKCEYPEADKFARHALSLPIFHELTPQMQDYVISSILSLVD